MTREELKTLLLNKPNEFWEFVKIEGLSETVVSVLDEADAELDGSNVELSPLMSPQVLHLS